ncbi:acyl-CoA dehydratase activase [Dehalogenimonas sp. THU2]|uniref:acyl-CoA dehydratase activase n=1 Tax=Dehalogenimonas sp. THU2 TaxID=3151121 RepID=UPI0032185BB1
MNLVCGVDVGSVGTKTVVLSADSHVLASVYLPTGGDPLQAVRRVLAELTQGVTGHITGIAVTGSARELVGKTIGADIIKNEITCQSMAAAYFLPGVKTVIEIGGQDSKLIILQDGLVRDFAMNTVCAAGTGSFLEHQSRRLGLKISDFAARSLESRIPVKVTGRCTVFAESDMIHYQQTGASLDDIIYGLCLALVRNFLGDAGRARMIETPIIFQGGVARNAGMIRAFEEILASRLIVPPLPEFTGAIGAALLLQRELTHNNRHSSRYTTRQDFREDEGRG